MNNLFQGFITSLVMLLFLSISLFLNKYIWLFTLILVSLVLFIEFNNLTKKIWKNKKNIIVSINTFSLLFLVILIYVSYKSYYIPPTGLIFIISICIFSDTGGYVVGNLIGGRKLTKISPNKTISGSLGSFIFSLFSIVILWFADRNFVTDNYLKLISLCLFLCLICQLGDLFISYFKRKANVNDTGSILPGHGGFLDRIDGILFAIPFGILILKLLF